MTNIHKLSENEKDIAISEIVKKGIIKPSDKLREILDVKHICTFHTIFFGVEDCLFLGLLIAACLWFFLIQADSQVIVCLIFAFSPFAYIVSYLLTAWKEHLLQLYEVKMTCKYTIRQISAFRMIYFSGFNIFLNVLLLSALIKFWFSAVIFWKILGLSFSAVFLYGVIMLVFQIKGKLYLTIIFPPALWGIVNAWVIAFYGEKLEGALLNLAGGLLIAIMAAVFMIYLITLFTFLISTSQISGSRLTGCLRK
ncbi:MAG: hypothetical protein NC433_09265 [Clostridiales bacterium]|nr:hypothetical protein [Clostridiales bacterium]